MNSAQAASLLGERIDSYVAYDVAKSVDVHEYEIFRVEGFVVHSNGHEGSLDLIFDLSAVVNLSPLEKRDFIATFIKNRCAPSIMFEVYGEPISNTVDGYG